MIFADQIRELLYTEECVIIPGMGAFITQYQAAEIRDDNNFVSPPSKLLGFNGEMTDDDGILITHLMNFLGKPTAEVKALIAQEIAKVFDAISEGKEYSIKGIGVLSRGKDGLLAFKADLGSNFHMDSFGLPSFTFPGLEEEKPSVFSNPIIFRQNVGTKVRESLPGTRQRKVNDRYAPAFIGIALVTFIVISLVPYNARVSDALFRSQASLGPLPSLVELDPPIEEVNQYNTEPIVQPAERDPQVQSGKAVKMYPIVAGSFQNRSNAENLVKELKTFDYQSRIEADRSFYRVILTEYSDYSEAVRSLPNLQAKHPRLNLWIKK